MTYRHAVDRGPVVIYDLKKSQQGKEKGSMTSSIKWEPIEDLKAINDTVRSLCARSWGRVPLPKWLGIRPPMDVAETGEAFVAKLDLPGVQAADLEVSVSGSHVTIKGKRPPAAMEATEGGEEAQVQKSVLRERPTGAFSRTLTVPDQADAEQISARLQQGVLTLTMPKKVPAPAVQVQVAPASGSTEG
jgi:HSP20 family protein